MKTSRRSCAAFLCLFSCGLFCGSGTASGLLAAAPAKTSLPKSSSSKSSSPRQSGPGIVVCEPVTTPASDAAGFGAGCALWLQMTVGGQPQFGKTPLWESLNRAAWELHRSDLRLSPAQATRLASITGVTHAAVGTLSGSGPHLILTYRLLQAPSGAAVGAPITLTGTRAQIDAKLPLLARTLALRLGAKSPEIPASTLLSPDDMQTLGETRRIGLAARADIAPGPQKALAALAARSPLAGLLCLSQKSYPTQTALNAAANTLLAQAGGNPLVWGEVADEDPLALVLRNAPLVGLAARYPGSYALAAAQAYYCLAVQDRPGEGTAAERAVLDAPKNPSAWMTEAFVAADLAENVRHTRAFPALTPAEVDTLGHLYPQWERAAQRATVLDPAYAAAWLELTKAATFTSDTAVGDRALQTALKFSPDKAAAYAWGLEMYQPKWGGDPAKLNAIAQAAAADTALTSPEVVSVARELQSGGSPDLRQKVLSDFLNRRREYLSAHPGDGRSHWGLATVLEAAGNKEGALTEYQTAVTLLPDSAAVRCDYGDALYSKTANTVALMKEQYQNAVRLDPDDFRGHLDLGRALQSQGDFEGAKRELRAALSLNPADGRAYSRLGDVFAYEPTPNYPAAIQNYQSAIQFGDFIRPTYEHLVWTLTQTQQYDQVIKTGNDALRIFINGDAPISDNMAEAYLHSKEWDKSIALDQATLALDANDAYAHESLAEAYLGAGRIPEAQAEWRKVLTLPNDQFKTIAQGYLKQYP